MGELIFHPFERIIFSPNPATEAYSLPMSNDELRSGSRITLTNTGDKYEGQHGLLLENQYDANWSLVKLDSFPEETIHDAATVSLSTTVWIVCVWTGQNHVNTTYRTRKEAMEYVNYVHGQYTDFTIEVINKNRVVVKVLYPTHK